jgi:hypothetical protein
MNRVQADFASHFSSVDYALALSAVTQYRRALQSWWHDGWDLLLTATLAQLPPPLGTFVNDPGNPMAVMQRAGHFVASRRRSTRAVNRPSASRWSGPPTVCPSVCNSSRATVVKTSSSALRASWSRRSRGPIAPRTSDPAPEVTPL